MSIPYFGELAGWVIAAAQRHDWSVLIERPQGDHDRERAALADLGPHMVDGALVSPQAVEAGDFTGLAVPVVLHGEHPLALPLDHVGIDNVRVARVAVRHLVAVRGPGHGGLCRRIRR